MGEFNGNGNGDDDEKKWDKPNSDNENDDDEEEALSLCDLPVLKNNGEDQKNTENCQSIEAEDFDFFGTDLTKESEMCVADEVFFKGQILPLRLSVSSESGFKQNSTNSRSESMDRSSSNGFTTTSLSSRSNSTSSHNSTTTTTTNTTTTTTTSTSTYKPKIRNQFHSHPSPKPQIISCSRPANASNRSRKSSIWGIFKVGLIRTPGIELQELKLRNNKERGFNSRSSSSNSSRKSDIEVKTEKKMLMKKKKTDRFGFENCRCSVDAVETVVSIKKTNYNNNKKKNIVINERETREKEEDDVKEKEVIEKKEKQSKQALYHTRTFEWLKELSIADVPVEL